MDDSYPRDSMDDGHGASTSNSQGMLDDEDDIDSPFMAYKRLIDMTENETNAPELLPIDEDVVDAIIEQIEFMKQNLKAIGPTLTQIVREAHTLELERYTFVVTHYLRTRLVKIETHAAQLAHMIKQDPSRANSLVTSAELKYLEGYLSSFQSHLENNATKLMPPNCQNLTIPQPPPLLNYHYHFVFAKVHKDVSLIVKDPIGSGDQQIVRLKRGEQRFLPYECVRKQLLKNSRHITLI